MIEQQSQVMQMFRSQYTCSISNKVMRKPVIDQQGFSYQQQDIKQYFTNNLNCVSPLTGKEFTSKKLIQNIYLQNLIEKVQTEIPKLYTYIKTLKNQILHLKLENQILNQEKSLNLSQMQNQNQNQNNHQTNINNLNINNNNHISNGNYTISHINNGKESKQSNQQSNKNDQQKYKQSQQKPQSKLSKRKLIKKYKFQKYYDHSMGQLLNSQKILSEELKNKQKITNQRKIKKYQKLNITNSKTIQNLIERLNNQQKIIKNIKQNNNNNNPQSQKQIIHNNNNSHQQKQQKQTIKNYIDRDIQTSQSYQQINQVIKAIRQEKQINLKIINNLQKQNVLLKAQIQKLKTNLQQLLNQNKMLKNNAPNSQQQTKQLEELTNRIFTQQKQISNKTWQIIKLQQQVKQNIRQHKIDLIQQQQKTNSLQRKINQVQSRNKYIKTLQTQLKQKINQISNNNAQNQKIRKADIKQIQLLESKNQQLMNNIKLNTEIWVMFLIIIQDSFTNFKQDHQKSSVKPNQIKSDKNNQILPIFKKNKKQVEVIQIIDQSQDQNQQNKVSDQQNNKDLKIQQMQVQIPIQNLPVVNKSLTNIQKNCQNAEISDTMVDQTQKWSGKSFDEWILHQIDILSKRITQKIIGFNSLQSSKIKQLSKVFRKLSFLKKVESDVQKRIFPNFYVAERSQGRKKEKKQLIGYEFELINLLRILSRNEFTDLVWDEPISIKSVSSEICNKQWQVLMKYSVLYPNIVELNLCNSRISKMRKQDIERLENLKVINLGNAPLSLVSIKELIQYKKYQPQVQFRF